MSEKREWYTHGVATSEPPQTPFRLSAKFKKELLKVIDSTHPKSDEFLKVIEDSIFSAKILESHRNTVLPSNVRKNLSRAHKLTEKLLDSLEKLDQFSRQLLSDSAEVPTYHEIRAAISSYQSQILSAHNKAQQLPKRGKLYQGHCRLLSYLVAEAINDILGVKPTLSHNEPSAKYPQNFHLFAQCLEIALRAASFYPNNRDPLSSENRYYLMKEGITTLEQREIIGGLTILRKGSF